LPGQAEEATKSFIQDRWSQGRDLNPKLDRIEVNYGDSNNRAGWCSGNGVTTLSTYPIRTSTVLSANLIEASVAYAPQTRNYYLKIIRYNITSIKQVETSFLRTQLPASFLSGNA
jgi:hypothetical protein